jgi:hypothetical protein
MGRRRDTSVPDPFAGSASALVEARRLRRRRQLEIDRDASRTLTWRSPWAWTRSGTTRRITPKG